MAFTKTWLTPNKGRPTLALGSAWYDLACLNDQEHMNISSMKVAFFLVALAGQSSAQRAFLKADCDSVSYGKSCTLSWDAAGRDAYIFGLGKVGSSGTAKVSPESSTIYTLITEEGNSVSFDSVRINVEGLKGGGDFPSPDDFNPILQEQKKVEYFQFLDRVQGVLQGDSFHVHGSSLPHDPTFLLYTDWAPQPNLLRPGDKGIRGRRVAYGVLTRKQSNSSVVFYVQALVKYQRMGESDWRDETDKSVIRFAEDRLKAQLD